MIDCCWFPYKRKDLQMFIGKINRSLYNTMYCKKYFLNTLSVRKFARTIIHYFAVEIDSKMLIATAQKIVPREFKYT